MGMMYCRTVCGVCGKERIELEMNDSSMCPDRDLDFREWSMFQYGREAWIQECIECGFVSENLEEGKPSYLEFLNSKEYRIVDSIVLSNSLATLYYKYALFNLYLNRTEKAYYSYLHCSWCFDDQNNKEAAAHCRKKAIALFPFLETYSIYSPLNFFLSKERFSLDKKELRKMKPILCLVFLYSTPGFPSPTISFIFLYPPILL